MRGRILGRAGLAGACAAALLLAGCAGEAPVGAPENVTPGGAAVAERAVARYGDWMVLLPETPGDNCTAMTFERTTRYFRNQTPVPPEEVPPRPAGVGFAIGEFPGQGLIPAYNAGQPIAPREIMGLLAGRDRDQYPLQALPGDPRLAVPAHLTEATAIVGRIMSDNVFFVATTTTDGLLIMDRFDTGGAESAIQHARTRCP